MASTTIKRKSSNRHSLQRQVEEFTLSFIQTLHPDESQHTQSQGEAPFCCKLDTNPAAIDCPSGNQALFNNTTNSSLREEGPSILFPTIPLSSEADPHEHLAAGMPIPSDTILPTFVRAEGQTETQTNGGAVDFKHGSLHQLIPCVAATSVLGQSGGPVAGFPHLAKVMDADESRGLSKIEAPVPCLVGVKTAADILLRREGTAVEQAIHAPDATGLRPLCPPAPGAAEMPLHQDAFDVQSDQPRYSFADLASPGVRLTAGDAHATGSFGQHRKSLVDESEREVVGIHGGSIPAMLFHANNDRVSLSTAPKLDPASAQCVATSQNGAALSGARAGLLPTPARTPPSSAPSLKLSSYLGPPLLDAMYVHGGMPETMYRWQAECLTVEDWAVLEGRRNLVFSAPTSAGKTLVAEVLMLRALAIDPSRKVLLVLPFVALCREKAARLRPLIAPLDKEVKESHGGAHSRGVLGPTAGIIVATIENANSLMNRLMETGVAVHEEFSCVVVDELHMLGDSDRGYQLELLLNKLRYHETKARDLAAVHKQQQAEGTTPQGDKQVSPELKATTHTTTTKTTTTIPGNSPNSKGQAVKHLQIVGMSATLPNLGVVASWLDAACYQTNFRPIPLFEYLKHGQEMFELQVPAVSGLDRHSPLAKAVLKPVRHLPPPAAGDDDHIAFLVGETVSQGHSVLVFCATKRGCESEAARLAQQLHVGVRPSVEEENKNRQHNGNDQNSDDDNVPGMLCSREAVAEELESIGLPQARSLASLVRRGIAYHTSDLSRRERELIEGAYRFGAVRVLCATSTLAAGVNLPARRVIFRDAYVAIPEKSNWLSVSRYRQMAGRAGRAGIDERGEAVLVVTRGKRASVPRDYLEMLLCNDLEPVCSCLSEITGMKRSMLEIVASGSALTPDDIRRYVNCTLLMASANDEESRSAANVGTKKALVALGGGSDPLIYWDKELQEFCPTPLGRAVLASGLSPEDALTMKVDLSRARESFVMSSELHACYLCVPTHIDLFMDRTHWMRLYKLLQEMHRGDPSGPDCKATKAIGVDMGYVFNRHRGYCDVTRMRGGKETEADRICRHFYAACILHELIQERSPAKCMELFGVKSVTVESLQEAAARFAAKARAFCERMAWPEMAAVLETFGTRVTLGAKTEIISLTRIKGVRTSTARLLYSNGLTDPEKVAATDMNKLEKILGKGPRYKGVGRDEAKRVIRNKASEILAAAKRLREAETALLRGLNPNQEPTEPMDAVGNGRDSLESIHHVYLGNNGTEKGTERAALKRKRSPMPENNHGGHDVARFPPLQQPEQQAVPGPVKKRACPQERQFSPPIPMKISDPKSLEPPIDPGALTLVTTEAGLHSLVAILSRAPRFAAQFVLMPAPKIEDDTNVMVPARRRRPFAKDSHQGGFPTADLPPGTPLGVAVSWAPLCGAFIPFHPCSLGKFAGHLDQRFPGAASEALGRVMGSASEVVWYDWRGQVHATQWLLRRGGDGSFVDASSAFRMVDAEIAAWMLAPDAPPSISDQELRRRAGIAMRDEFSITDTEKTARRQMGSRAVDACTLASDALQLYEWASTILTAQGEAMVHAFKTLEMAVVPVLADMEAWGVGVSADLLGCLLPRLENRLNEVQAEARRLTGMRTLDLKSPHQVQIALYEKLGLPAPPCAERKRTRKDGTLYMTYSTDKEALTALAALHPVVPLIAEHRKLRDTLETARDLLDRCAGKANISESVWAELDGVRTRVSSVARVCGRILHTATATGRLAMEEPNLQCLPRPHPFVRRLSQPLEAYERHSGADGLTPEREHVQDYANLRAAIVPVCQNRVMLSADFKQFEFRMMAHFSGDEALRTLLADDGGQDPFRLLASRWKKVCLSEVTEEMREHVKQLTYALCYGMGPMTMADRLGTTPRKALKLKDEFLEMYAGIRDWLQRVVEQCRDLGYVASLLGRRRFLPNIRAEDGNTRAGAERAAVNTVCQASAADVAKVAMIKIHKALHARGLASRAALVLQIHDELLFEVEEHCLVEVATLVKEHMEAAAPLEVPLRVQLAMGPSWGELRDVTLSDLG